MGAEQSLYFKWQAHIFNFFRINLAMQPFFYIKLREKKTWFDKN